MQILSVVKLGFVSWKFYNSIILKLSKFMYGHVYKNGFSDYKARPVFFQFGYSNKSATNDK